MCWLVVESHIRRVHPAPSLNPFIFYFYNFQLTSRFYVNITYSTGVWFSHFFSFFFYIYFYSDERERKMKKKKKRRDV